MIKKTLETVAGTSEMTKKTPEMIAEMSEMIPETLLFCL